MVALNTAYAPSETRTQPKNRVGNFFGRVGDCAEENRLSTRNRIGENGPTLTKSVSGRPFWINRDPIEEYGGWNLYRYVGNDPMNFWDPYGFNAAVTWGGRIVTGGLITTQADSPAPGPADVIGLGIAATGAAIWSGGKIYDWIFNSEEAGAVDGAGESCSPEELTPTGETKTEPSTKKGNKGGESVQEGYKDKQGRPVTEHTIFGPNGNVVHGPHFRPGGFK